MEANIILTAMNVFLFIVQIIAFSVMCNKVDVLVHNDKRALEKYNKYLEAERDMRNMRAEYEAKIDMLDRAEEIAAIIAKKENAD